MSISTIVTRGYGSFGDVYLLPVRGYSIGETEFGFGGRIVFIVLPKYNTITVDYEDRYYQVQGREDVMYVDYEVN